MGFLIVGSASYKYSDPIFQGCQQLSRRFSGDADGLHETDLLTDEGLDLLEKWSAVASSGTVLLGEDSELGVDLSELFLESHDDLSFGVI